MIPSRLVGGRYLVLDGLGAGTLGPVWRAQDRVTGRLVVVREMQPPGPVDRTRFREALLRGARVIGGLRDPGLLVVRDVLHADGTDLVVTEYAEGIRLSDHVAAGGPLSYEDTAEVGRRMLETLRRAHGRGLVHGWLRPSSVILAENGRIVLSDTGLVPALAAVDCPLPVTDDGFTAPERLAGGAASPAADLWSLGTVLARMGAVEPPLSDVVDRLRAPDPGDRPDAATALADLAEAGDRRRSWFGFRRA